MKIQRKDVEISLGKAVGHVLEDLLTSAKERLWIISPWISPEYADLAVKKHKDGVDVQIITTDDCINSSHRKALEKLIEKREIETPKKFLGFGYSSRDAYFAFKIGNEKIVVQDRFTRFTHSKIYISDNVVALGSANLTRRGLWENVEVIAIIKNKAEVEELCKTFQNMKNNPMARKVEINELVKKMKMELPEEEREEGILEDVGRAITGELKRGGKELERAIKKGLKIE